MKNAVCKNSRTREYPGFTVQTEQGDFQEELHITDKAEYFKDGVILQNMKHPHRLKIKDHPRKIGGP